MSEDIESSLPFDIAEEDVEMKFRETANNIRRAKAEKTFRPTPIVGPDLAKEKKASPAGYPFNTEEHTEKFLDRYLERVADMQNEDARAQARALHDFFGLTRKALVVAKSIGLTGAKIDAETGEITLSLAPADV